MNVHRQGVPAPGANYKLTGSPAIMHGGTAMDDSITTLRRRPESAGPAASQRRPQRRPVQPHHRRRRLVAVLVLIGLVIVIALLLGSGGSSPTATAPAASHVTTGYFTRIETLAGHRTGLVRRRREGGRERRDQQDPDLHAIHRGSRVPSTGKSR